MTFDTIPVMMMSLDKYEQNLQYKQKLQNSWETGLTVIVLVFDV